MDIIKINLAILKIVLYINETLTKQIDFKTSKFNDLLVLPAPSQLWANFKFAFFLPAIYSIVFSLLS